jgi:ABC-type nitrate/sulfonate/bicarbonate transport system substrate-binding protein
MSRPGWVVRQALRLLLAGWLGALASGVTAAPLTLAIGDLPQFTLLLVAEQQGYFEKEGLDLRITHCVNGRACLKLLTDGKVQVAAAVETPIVLALHGGARFDIVATVATSTKGDRFVVRRDRGIRSAADLVGRRIGFVKDTGGHFFTSAFLYFHGIDPAAVTLVPLDPADPSGALVRGEVDAAGFYQPHAYIALKALGDKAQLLPSAGLHTATVNLVARRGEDTVSDADLLRLLRALRRAQQHVEAQPMAAKRSLARALKLEGAVFDAVFDDFDYRLALDQSLLGSLEAQSRWAMREGLVRKGPLPDFLEHVRSGPLKALEPRAVTMPR